ncbi:MAG TPA: cyanophycin synthetase, partial [Saprospiraceae bacterium]|nr:cyanophycin synthetase [Saprospiraceae bacterium]
ACAVTAALDLGITDEVIANALATFVNMPHRLEYVATIGGVSFINDSKATNVDAAWYGLSAVNNPVIWIVGGTDKGNDYTPLTEQVKNKVKAIVCMGADNSKIIDFFSNIVETIKDTHSAEEAVDIAFSLANQGDTVLLSPACASFDLFNNYEHRGETFKKAVKNLIIKIES